LCTPWWSTRTLSWQCCLQSVIEYRRTRVNINLFTPAREIPLSCVHFQGNPQCWTTPCADTWSAVSATADSNVGITDIHTYTALQVYGLYSADFQQTNTHSADYTDASCTEH
jgi:hypothetical protein